MTALREIHVAVITDNQDPEQRGRLKVRSDTLLAGKEHPRWAEPLFPYAGKGWGWFFIPEVGSSVEIEIAAGHASVDFPAIYWRAVLYSNEDPIPAVMKEHYPKRKGLRTPAGLMLLFDDAAGEELIQLLHAKGTGVQFNKDGDWLEKVVRDKVVEVVGQWTAQVSKGFKLTTGEKAIFACPEIDLGDGASEPLVLGQALKTYLDQLVQALTSHTHTGNLGAPTSPPLQPMPTFPDTALSQQNRTV